VIGDWPETARCGTAWFGRSPITDHQSLSLKPRGSPLRPIPPLLSAALLLASLAADAQEPRAPQSFRDCERCPEMVVVPAGAYVLGTAPADLPPGADPAEGEALLLRIPRAFGLGRYEVTREEYERFVAASGYEGRPGCRTWDPALSRFNDDARRTWLNPGRPAEPQPRHPVSCVSFADAQAYASWLARETGKRYRLPSEAEWEYAARAGSAALWPWGDAPETGCAHANVYDRSGAQAYRLGREPAVCADGQPDVAPVGQLEANALGIGDMIGNVAEWVEDCYTGSYAGRPRDARAWTWLGGCQRRVLRGGSWVSPPTAARSAHREPADGGLRADYVGFRVAMDLDERRSQP
jgi:formylglycine-generating enzyme required for sulfatase activity